ncbi:MAG: transposase [Planctomycetia bacterium]|nr:transposase [Planctomycetia bacterium]
MENWLHNNRYGSCCLNDPIAANIVIDAWYFYADEWYDLYEWVVMGNHVHILIRQYEGHRLADIVSAWKGFTSKQIARQLHVPQPIWREGYWDRMIRDAEHFQKARNYILNNPAKSGLTDWPYISSSKGNTEGTSEGGRPRPPKK